MIALDLIGMGRSDKPSEKSDLTLARDVEWLVPGAHGLDHVVLDGPNHFIQHDAPDDLVRIIDAFVGA